MEHSYYIDLSSQQEFEATSSELPSSRPQDPSPRQTKSAQKTDGVVQQYIEPVMTGCRWIKHVNRSLPPLVNGAENELHLLCDSPAAIAQTLRPAIVPAHAVADEAKELTQQFLKSTPIKYTVHAAKVISLYSAYKSLRKCMDETKASIRAFELGDELRGVRGMVRGLLAGASGVKSTLSGLRSFMSLAQLEPFSGAYKGPMRNYVWGMSNITNWINIGMAKELLDELDEHHPQTHVDLLKSLLEPTDDELVSLSKLVANSGDPELGNISEYRDSLVAQLRKDKVAELETFIGKPAVAIIKDLKNADDHGQPRISDARALHYFRQAVELHIERQQKSAAATGAALAGATAALCVPEVTLLAYALDTLSIALTTEMMVDDLRKSEGTTIALENDEEIDLEAGLQDQRKKKA